jgi:hypothetical protein
MIGSCSLWIESDLFVLNPEPARFFWQTNMILSSSTVMGYYGGVASCWTVQIQRWQC